MKAKFKSKLTAIVNDTKDLYKSSGIDEKVTKTKEFLDETGVTKKVNDVSDSVGNHFDVVSGTKQLILVEERLELQAKYNDLLAQKLDEALTRIAALEQSLKKEAS